MPLCGCLATKNSIQPHDRIAQFAGEADLDHGKPP